MNRNAPAFTNRLLRCAEQNFRWVCIIKRWLTWEGVSLIFFLSGPVQFKDITTKLIACSISCRKWWRNHFTSEVISLSLLLNAVSSTCFKLALRASSPVPFLSTFIKSIRKECTGFWKPGKQFNNDVLKDNGNNFDQPCKLASKWTRIENNKTILKSLGVAYWRRSKRILSMPFTGFNWILPKKDRKAWLTNKED